jgi:hypothetical protein
MVEILKSFEQVAGRLNPLVMIVPGLLMVALGLFVWLGGLGMRRVLFAMIGAVAGGAAALLFVSQNGTIAGAAAIVAAVAAAVFQRIVTALLLGLLSLAVTFVILARPGLREYQGTLIGGQKTGQNDQRMTVRDSLSVARIYRLEVIDAVRYAAGRLIPVQWAIIAAVTAGLLTVGAFFRSLGGALSCAILGTALIFAGLVLLLIFKGSMPVGRIEARPALYGLVFAGMGAFGTLEQLALCRRAEQRKAKARKSQSDTGESKRSWRNR